MSEKINDGGPAFPFQAHDHDGSPWEPTTGMSLRDYFAIHAPEPPEFSVKVIMDRERMANPHNEPYHNKVRRRGDQEIRCALRYEFADAMLRARSGG